MFTAIGIGFIALRFWRLTDSCLWFDEIFSVHAATLGWTSLFELVARDLIHPPFFYVLLKIWIAFGSENLIWLRSFPVLFSALSIVPFYFLCRQLKLEHSTTILALAFLAVNGSLIKYAQEVRMYSLLVCLSLFSMWLFLRFFQLGKSFWLLTLVNVLLVYTQYFGWTIVASEVLAILILQRIKIGKIFLMFGVTALGFLPWFFAVFRYADLSNDAPQNLGWASAPNFSILVQFTLDLFEPFHYQQSNADAASIYLISIPLLLIGLTAFAGYFMNWKTVPAAEKKAVHLLLIFLFFPIVVAFAASWILPFSIWGTRHLTMVFAPLAILAALAVNKITIPPLKLIVIYTIFVFFGIAFFARFQQPTPEYIWCAWEKLARELPENEPAKIYVYEDLVAYHLWFALRGAERLIQIIKINGIPELIEDKAYFLPRGFDAVQATDENGIVGDGFQIAFRDTNFDSAKPPLKNLIEKGYRIGQPKVFQAQGQKAFLVPVEKIR